MFDSALPVKPKLSLSSRKRRLEHTEQLVVDTPDSSPKSLSSYEIDELAQLFDEFIDESGPYKKNRLIPETSESIVAIPNASPPRILPPSTASATPNSTRPATKSNPDTSIPLTKATIEIDGSPHAHQPSPPPIPRAPPPKVPRKLGSLENVFTEDQVRSWSAARIHAWNIRHTNPEAYYYRFVDPTEGQFNGGFKRSDHDAFMARLAEWRESGYKIGSAWGLFSKGIPHKAGYMCSSYYRKLLEQRRLTDEAYGWVDGKLVMVNKQRQAGSGPTPESRLSGLWDSPEVKLVEDSVNRWLKQYHNTAISSAPKASPTRNSTLALSASLASPKSSKVKPLPKVVAVSSEAESIDKGMLATSPANTATATNSGSSSSANNTSAKFKAPYTIPNLEYKNRMRQLAEIRANQAKQANTASPSRPPAPLATTNAKPTTSTPVRTATLTELRVTKVPTAAMVDPDSDFALPPTTIRTRSTQIDLSRFWKDVKAPEAPIPEPIMARIPNPIPNTWAKCIQTLETQFETIPEPTEYIWMEVKQMEDLDLPAIGQARLENLDLATASTDKSIETPDSTPVLEFEGIVVDPPWTYLYDEESYLACLPPPEEPPNLSSPPPGGMGVTVDKVASILEKILPSLPRGMVFLWTHKTMLPQVVEMMQALDCRYVENLIWFKKALHHGPLNRPSPYFRSAKETLLLFKKGDGFDIRHQRSADVIIDFARPVRDWIYHDWTEPKPDAVYDMIETLLPNAAYDCALGRGKLLELWSSYDGPRRPGWVYVREPKCGLEHLEDPYRLVPSLAAAMAGTASRITEVNGTHEPPSTHPNREPVAPGQSLQYHQQKWRKSRLIRKTCQTIRAGSAPSMVIDAEHEAWLIPRRLALFKELTMVLPSEEADEVCAEIITQIQ